MAAGAATAAAGQAAATTEAKQQSARSERSLLKSGLAGEGNSTSKGGGEVGGGNTVVKVVELNGNPRMCGQGIGDKELEMLKTDVLDELFGPNDETEQCSIPGTSDDLGELARSLDNFLGDADQQDQQQREVLLAVPTLDIYSPSDRSQDIMDLLYHRPHEDDDLDFLTDIIDNDDDQMTILDPLDSAVCRSQRNIISKKVWAVVEGFMTAFLGGRKAIKNMLPYIRMAVASEHPNGHLPDRALMKKWYKILKEE